MTSNAMASAASSHASTSLAAKPGRSEPSTLDIPALDMMNLNPGRLRVLYVDNSVGFGGAIKSLALTLRQIPGVEALVLTSQDQKLIRTWLNGFPVWSFRRLVNYKTTEEARSWIRKRVRAGAVRWFGFKLIAAADEVVMLKNMLWLTYFLRRHRIELVHLNNGFHPREALLAARLTRTDCVVHLRGFHTDLTRTTLREMGKVAQVITVSAAVADGLDGLPAPRDRITVVHDPVDLPAVAASEGLRDRVRERHGLGPNDVVMGIFGRVIEWKGQMVFVEAAIHAMKENPNIRALIVGDESDGGRSYIGKIRATIEASGMSDRFVLAGYREDVEAYYWGVDVVVHASIEAEPFGMVVPEGMAAGRAVVAADEGGPREVVTHGVDGLLVPPGDVAALSAAMQRLADDPEERQRLGAAAYETAQSRFGIAVNAAAVRAVYDRLAAGVSNGGRLPVAGPPRIPDSA